VKGWKKASITACLFLLSLAVDAQQWSFSEEEALRYQRVLNLDFESPGKDESLAHAYTRAMAESLELLLSEDPTRYEVYEKHFTERLNKKRTESEALQLFLQAEVNLQWSFVYLKFGHDISAARALKRAYAAAEECREKYPSFVAIRKTSGVLQVILGSVPEKYTWVLNLFGMQGSVEKGLALLHDAELMQSPLKEEAVLMICLMNGFVLQQPDSALRQLNSNDLSRSHPRLHALLASVMYMKNSETSRAIELLREHETELQSIALSHYLLAEGLLQRGDYAQSADEFDAFIADFKGQNYIKDSYYKKGQCLLFLNRPADAQVCFEKAKKAGQELTEADKNASRGLLEKTNLALLRIRYFTDGGFFNEAARELDKITPAALTSKSDQVEFYYRKARLLHKTSRTEAAKLFYRQTIDMSPGLHRYFAPNACLQLGYISREEGDAAAARSYFLQALRYDKHEYKNSIDSKARAALRQMRRR